MTEHVILVDERDRDQGVLEKAQAHVEGRLHRALSVVVFGTDGRMLLQQRALTKYHSGGLWTNTCCSHPRPGEATEAAAHRRLEEEMGFDCALVLFHKFIYRAEVGGGLYEHELDHVFVGTADVVPRCDPEEVMDWRYFPVDSLWRRLAAAPAEFTVWFHIVMGELAARGQIAAPAMVR